MEIEVIDNFLPEQDFCKIRSIIESPKFPWYYNHGINYRGDGKYQFTHMFYVSETGISSDYFSIFDEFLSRLVFSKLLRIKANLNPKTFFKQNTGFHVDYSNAKTSIFYINTNNGGTKFQNGKFIKSTSNRLVSFDSNIKHAGITCTDKKRRLVINVNYTCI